MSAPEKILALITRFDNNLEAYRSGKYNEAQLRQEFLNPVPPVWDMQSQRRIMCNGFRNLMASTGCGLYFPAT